MILSKRQRRARMLVLVSLCIVIVAVSLAVRFLRFNGPSSDLALAVAQIPIGSPAFEAKQRLGMEPHESERIQGVFMGPATFLTATNSRAKDYGSPQWYTMHRYEKNGYQATLAIDSDGRVAGHWSTKK